MEFYMLLIVTTILIIFLLFFIKKTTTYKNLLLQKDEQIQQNQLELTKMEQLILHSKDNIANLNNEIIKLQEENKNLNNEKNIYLNKNTELETKLSLQEKQIEEEKEKLNTNFKNIANEILENSNKKLTEQNKHNISQILTPVQTQLSEFKKKVEDVYDKEAKDRSFLSAELKNLKELNLKISNDAINLTNALKGEKKQQGIWGEMVLEKVLENSGLREGHEFTRETYLKDEDGSGFRPDVIVNLPDDRHIIIDAKTSLNSYNEYISSSDESKEIHLKKHIMAIKEHIKSLATKKYENLNEINSLDFIFMFLPIEGALLLALENDVNLYDEAFKQKIILVSPTTLLVALRAVENIWRYERQAQSIADVAKRAELLYSKFNGFVEDMSKVSDTLDKANDTHQKAFDKLSRGSGNLISQVTMLKKVSNIKPKKEINKTLVENSMEDTLELSE